VRTQLARTGTKRTLVRYYFCDDHQVLWRISNRLFSGLVSGELSLPRFAGKRQKGLEVFFSYSAKKLFRWETRAVIFPFSTDGTLDLNPALETYAATLEGARPRKIAANVIDIGPTIRTKKWITEQRWTPSREMIEAIEADIAPTSGSRKIPRLPTPTS
jgi:hypothetical protein